MARISKRKAQPVRVPSLEQDAGERKRVLNVLAQRRYRERKRQRYEELESKIATTTTPATTTTTTTTTTPETPETPNKSTISVSEIQAPNDDFVQLGTNDLDLNMYAMDGQSNWDTSVLFPTLSNPLDTSRSSSSSGALSPVPTSVDSLNFPDEILLPILELNLLKAGLTIAKRLDVDSTIWDLTALSPFNNCPLLTYDHLPINFQPTFTQLTIPHHPVLDILPWPEVRDKLIFIFSQPEDLRPPSARSPTAMVDFVYDMEDSAEGIRVSGDDPYARNNWELGQQIFRKWWWAFTKDIIDHSNSVREARGATKLTGMILGEVS